MAKVSGAQQLDDLYNQLLNSFDNDGPDLNLVSPTQTPPPVPPPPPAAPTMPPPNLNHSQSYVDDRESGRDTPDRSLPPPNQRGLNVSTTPGSMYPNISPNGTTTLPAADSYFSSQTSPSSGRSRPLPPPPGAAPPRMSSSPNGFVAPPPPPPLHVSPISMLS
ncbi:hypothetical protein DL93DRAFT_756783 [Clavulina sp. PMI_390]|nr:hypothetical protein DL93DRAFT_756783 [Clavulina sp. PMI_390]